MRTARHLSSILRGLFIATLVAVGGGCDDGLEGTGGAGASGTTTTGGTTNSASATSTTTGSTSSGGTCTPGSTLTCYEGPTGTLDVGACKAGVTTCDAQGQSYGACEGQVTPTTEVCGGAIDLDCSGATVGCGSFGPATFVGPADVWVPALATDPSGNIFIGGYFKGELVLGATTLSSPTGDPFVAKLSPSGGVLWAKQFGDGSGDDVYRVAADSAGNVILALDFYGSADFGGGVLTSAGAADLAVVKLDPQGNHVWSKRFGDAGDQAAYTLAVDPNDDVIVAGGYDGTIDFGAGPLPTSGLSDVYVAKLSAAAGAPLWSKRFGSATNHEAAYDMTTDSAGAVILVGPMDGDTDFGGGTLVNQGYGDVFVTKLDATGQHVFSRSFGDPTPQWATHVAAGPSDGIVVAGVLGGTVDFGVAGTLVGDGDVFLLSLTKDGAPVWSKSIPSDAELQVNGLAVDASGHIFLVGNTAQPLDLGGGPLGTQDVKNGFFAELYPTGALLASEDVKSDAASSADRLALVGGAVVLCGGVDGIGELGGQSTGSATSAGVFVATYYP